MAITLGDAVLFFKGDDTQLDKDLKGAESKTKGFFGGLAGNATKLLGGAIVGGAVAATAAVVGVGAAAFGVANNFQDATNAIITGTGASGESLAEMEGIVKNLAGSSAGLNRDMGELGAVVAEVNTRTGATGDSLQALSEQVLNMTRLTGGDAVENVQLLTRVMGDWSVSMEDSAELTDMLFGASQAFGIGVEDLSRKVVQFGAPLRQMGFTLEESVALFGKWEKEGVNAELAIGSLRIAAGKFAKEGVDLEDGLRDTMEAIKGAKTESEGLSIAMEVFGARAGPDMAAAIREGRFELDSAIEALKGTQGGLEDASDRALKFGDRLQIMKNRISVALLPLGNALLDIAEEIMPAVQAAVEKIVPIIAGLFESRVLPVIQDVTDFFKGFFTELQNGEDILGAAIEALLNWTNVGENMPDEMFDFVIGLEQFIREQLLPIFQQFADWLINEGIPGYIDFAKTVIAQVVPGLQLLAEIGMNIATAVWPLLVQATQFVIDNWNILEPIVIAIGIAILALSSPVTLVAGLIVTLATAWANNWGDIQGKTQAVIDFIVPLIEGAMEAIESIVGPVLEYLSKWWDDHGENVMLIIRTVFAFVVKYVTDRIKETQDVIEAIGEAIRKFWDAWGSTLMELARLAWNTIMAIVRAAMEIIGGIIDAAAALIRGDWEAFGAALEGIWRAWWTLAATIVNNQIAAIKAVVTNLIKQVKDPWNEFVDGLRSAWENMWDGIVDYLSGIVDRITDAINDIIDTVKDLFDIDLPKIPGLNWGFGNAFGSNVGGGNSFSLTLNSAGRAGSLAGEFQAMEALLGT